MSSTGVGGNQSNKRAKDRAIGVQEGGRRTGTQMADRCQVCGCRWPGGLWEGARVVGGRAACKGMACSEVCSGGGEQWKGAGSRLLLGEAALGVRAGRP